MIHVCLVGPPGTFKTSSGYRLVELYPQDATWVSRYNTIVPRYGEVDGAEYKYISDEEFDRLLDCGFLFDKEDALGKTKHPDGTETRRGTSHPRHWPTPKSLNGFRVSVFGPRFAWQLEETLARNMTCIYLDGSKDIILQRVGERHRSPNNLSRDHWKNIHIYKEMRLAEKYKHVINTDGLNPEKVVQEIIRIAKLHPHKPVLRKEKWYHRK